MKPIVLVDEQHHVPTKNSLLDVARAVEALHPGERVRVRIAHNQGGICVRVGEEPERLIRDGSVQRLGLELGVREAFFCTFCDAPLPAGPAGLAARYRTKSGEGSYCGKCIPECALAFEADIRVGDVVEVVGIDHAAMDKAFERWSVDLPCRGTVSVSEPSVTGAPWFCLLYFSSGKEYCTVVAVHGRFRILERDGKPYYRPQPDARIPASHEAGYAGYRRVPSEGAKRLIEMAVGAPEHPPCAWCGKTTSEVGGVMVHASGTPLETWRHETCDPYWTALQERLRVGGAHDCPEERESVKRWVDGLSPPVIDDGCHDCGRECDGYRCRDCERMVYSDIPRMALELRIHDADLDKSEDWSAGSTPGADWP